MPSPEQERGLARARRELDEAKSAFVPHREALEPAIAAWEKEGAPDLPEPPPALFHEAFEGGVHGELVGTPPVFAAGLRGEALRFDATRHVEAPLADFDPDEPWTISLWLKADGSLGCPLSLIEPYGGRRGLELVWQKGRLQVNLVHRWGIDAIELVTIPALASRQWHHVLVSYDGTGRAAGLRVFLDGVAAGVEIQRDSLGGSIRNAEPLRIGRRDEGLGFYGAIDELRVAAGATGAAEARAWFWSERIRGILEREPSARDRLDRDTLLSHYLEGHGDAAANSARQRLVEAERAERRLRDSLPTALVMEEMDPPRPTRLLERGRYDQPRQAVEPGVPEAIAPWSDEFPRNRLGFARWLLAGENPLAARVAVNRLWRHCFGEGLVRTEDDFGTRGEPPTHPELLDWLALEFRRSGWDVKALLKRIVMSRTYRQASRRSAGDPDPENRWLARGPSGRLPAETLRDQALAVSGLLVPEVGGPPVKPYQPPGLWEAVSYNGEDRYEVGSGEALWRRSLYTYVKRQAPPPLLLTFDGPTREKCSLRRGRTNTPLQALLMLNDETFVEAARVLAATVLHHGGGEAGRLRAMWRRVLVREPDEREIAGLAGLLERQRARFGRDREAAVAFLSGGAAPRDASLDPVEHAAWALVAHTLLNLDETLTKP